MIVDDCVKHIQVLCYKVDDDDDHMLVSTIMVLADEMKRISLSKYIFFTGTAKKDQNNLFFFSVSVNVKPDISKENQLLVELHQHNLLVKLLNTCS